ncbi:MAG: hypothetical protein JWN00_1299 [Actinomycetia bacterium]|nr:hypothetical protein [Actinomycetes bacterium]
MTDIYERRCRALLRAYPPRYRTVREAEVLATLLEAAAPGQRVPSPRDSWDVVRGGLRTRLRTRPPLWRWLGYRVLNAKLPTRWQWWVHDDVLGRLYFLRRWLAGLSFMLISGGLPQALLAFQGIPPTIPGPRWVLALIGFSVFVEAVALRRQRRRVLSGHGFAKDGTLLPTGPWSRAGVPELRTHQVPLPRRQCWPVLLILGAIGLAAAPAAAIALLDPVGHEVAVGAESFGPAERLGAIVPLLIGTGLVASVVAPTLLWCTVRRLSSRLRLRACDTERTDVPINGWKVAVASLVGIGASILIIAGNYLQAIPGISGLILAGAGIGFGPPMILAALIANAAERRTGILVTFTETLWAVLGPTNSPPPTGRRTLTTTLYPQAPSAAADSR